MGQRSESLAYARCASAVVYRNGNSPSGLARQPPVNVPRARSVRNVPIWAADSRCN
jgi:hypothetical protein